MKDKQMHEMSFYFIYVYLYL